MTDATDPTITGTPYAVSVTTAFDLSLDALNSLAGQVPDLKALLGDLATGASERACAAVLAPLTDAGIDLAHLVGYTNRTSVDLHGEVELVAGAPATPTE